MQQRDLLRGDAQNEPRVFNAMPVSDPLLYNLSVIGPGAMNMVTVGYRGAVMRRGTAGRIHNLIMTGYPTHSAARAAREERQSDRCRWMPFTPGWRC